MLWVILLIAAIALMIIVSGNDDTARLFDQFVENFAENKM
jgi:hypothetical protein